MTASLCFIATAVVIIPAILSLMVTWIFIGLISIIISRLSSKSFTKETKSADVNVLKIIMLFGSVLLLSVAIALYGIFVQKAWKEMLYGLVSTIVFIGLIYIMNLVII